MCGRFNLRTSATGIAQCFLPGIDHDQLPTLVPRYNIAPTQSIPCVFTPNANEPRQLGLFRWGLLPPWADDLTIGTHMINARAETIREKRSFKSPLKSRRCVVPADGYYEWMSTSEGKQPFEFSRRDGQLLAMAGLWETNKKLTPDSNGLRSCTVITTSANCVAAEVHDRMPVLLDEAGIALWLDPTLQDIDAMAELLKPAPDDWLTSRPVNKRLGNVRNEGADLLEI